MREHLDVAERTVMERLDLYRLGGHRVTVHVDDLDAYVAALRDAGIRVQGDPTNSRGPSGGQRWVCYLSTWGMPFELVCYPRREGP